MARVMPGGAPDYTTQIAAREAAANDALTRLYIALAARKEERLRQQEFMKDMLGIKDKLTRGIYDDYGPPGSRAGSKYPDYKDYVSSPPAPLGSGGAPSGAPAAAPPAPGVQMPQGPMVPNATPTGPPIGKFGSLQPNAIPGYNSFARAEDFEPPEGGNVTISAQTRKPARSYTEPRAPSSTRGTPQGFRTLDPRLVQEWTDIERQYNLPKGTLMMTLGLENAGGYNIGTNPKSAGGASGVFQFTRELAKEHGLSPADLQDPYKMGRALAINIDRNRKNMEKFAGVKYGDKPEDMPYYYMAHMWGAGNAPRIAKAMAKNPDVPLTSVLMSSRMADGRVVDPATTLANNNIPLNTTVRQYFDKLSGEKVAPWHSAALRYLDNPPNPQTPPQQVVSGPRNVPAQAQGGQRVPQTANQATERSGFRFGDEGSIVSIQFPDSSGRVFNMHKEAAPLAAEFVRRLYEAGAPINSLGGYARRMIAGTGHPSQHGYGTGLDVNQKSKNKVDSAFTKWLQKPENARVLGDILADLQIPSGGDWRSKDFGHFEFTPQAIAAYKSRQGGQTQTAEAPTTVTPAVVSPPQLPAEGVRAMTTKETVPTFGTAPAGQIQTMADNKKLTDKGAIPGMIAGAQPSFKPTAAPVVAGANPPPPIQPPQPQPKIAPVEVPKTAAIPPEVTAASGQATPQTAQTKEQPTQAPPTATPTSTPIPPDGGYTADDPSESAGLTQEQLSATGMSLGDLMTGASNFLTAQPKIGTALADKRYTDPSYVESTQGFDEGGMEGVDKYVTPEAVPGEGTNAVIDWIKKKAAEYTPGHLDRSQRLEDEWQVMAGRMRDPVSQARTSQYGTHYSPGLLQPDASKAMQEDILERRVANPPPATGGPDYSPGELDPNKIRAAQEILQNYGAQQSTARAQMPPQESGDPGRAGGIPTAPPPTATTGASTKAAPLPVEASKVAQAIYSQGEALPPGVSGGTVAMDWIKNLFKGSPAQPKPVVVDELPVKKVPTLMPGQTPFIVQQPPLNLPPGKGQPGAIGVQPGELTKGMVRSYTDDQGVERFEVVQ